jgi:uncharacterized protein YcnI
MRKLALLLASLLAALALVGAAQAHVTLHPNALPSGGFQTFVVRVPNERPKASTTKVDVKFPSGFIFLSYAAVPGWNAQVIYRKLAKPVTVFGEKFTQEVDRVVWTARAGGVKPGQFIEFPLSIAVPSAKAGTLLTFKAVQTYSNGEVVRWIGPPSADEPAPQVMVTNANSPVRDYPGGVSAARKGQSASDHILGFVVGLPLLGAAGLGILYRRRRHS